jgi:hypothetical protein
MREGHDSGGGGRHEEAPQTDQINTKGQHINRFFPRSIIDRSQGCAKRARYDPDDGIGELEFSRYTQNFVHR